MLEGIRIFTETATLQWFANVCIWLAFAFVFVFVCMFMCAYVWVRIVQRAVNNDYLTYSLFVYPASVQASILQTYYATLQLLYSKQYQNKTIARPFTLIIIPRISVTVRVVTTDAAFCDYVIRHVITVVYCSYRLYCWLSFVISLSLVSILLFPPLLLAADILTLMLYLSSRCIWYFGGWW